MSSLKKILLIKDGEARQLAFFLLLFLFLGAGMAIGRGTADALFLKRYGVEYLPVMYMILSIIYAVCFTVYAAFVDRLPPERFFYLLLVLQAFVLAIFWSVIVYTGSDLVYPAYFLLYELVSEIIVVHATFYVGQNLDTLQSKRLMPLVFAGYQLGMVGGGLFLASAVPVIGVENAIILWCCLIGACVGILGQWHRRNGASPFFIPPPRSRRNKVSTAIKEVTQGLHFIKQSTLLRNSSYALFFMVIMFYVLTFSVNKIYSESFGSEEELTSFFGYLVAATNLVALVLQLFVASRVVEKIGVRKAKLIYPVATLISYILLLVSPGFYVAVIASINNGSVMPAFRNPVRQMFFNILPDYMKGRARATSVALVLPAAIFTCGALILYLQEANDPSIIIIFGLFCALMYMWFCYRMGNEYVTALIDGLKEKLFLPGDISPAEYNVCDERMYSALTEGLANDSDEVSLSYAHLLLKLFPQASKQPVLRRLQSAEVRVADQLISLLGADADEAMCQQLLDYADAHDDHFKATVYKSVFSRAASQYTSVIEKSLLHENPRIKASGIMGSLQHCSENVKQRGMNCWSELLAGGHRQQMAAIELGSMLNELDGAARLELADRYAVIYSNLIESADEQRKTEIYKALQAWPGEITQQVQRSIITDINNVVPELRCAATRCLHLVVDNALKNSAIWKALGDGHKSVRLAALKNLEDTNINPLYVYQAWLLDHRMGSPRAQKVLLEAMISHGASHATLEQFIESKSNYASVLLSASHALSGATDSMSVNMVQTVIEERICQFIDIIMIALGPLMDSDVLSTVRAGLNSKDAGHRANAREALQSINNDRIILLLGSLIERNYKAVIRKGMGKMFTDAEEVLTWCIENGDMWLSECCARVAYEVRA